jgi:hypothetical protein
MVNLINRWQKNGWKIAFIVDGFIAKGLLVITHLWKLWLGMISFLYKVLL